MPISPLEEYENKKLNSGFRYRERKLNTIKPKVDFVSKDNNKEFDDNKIVCKTCTDNFFRIFFNEQIQDKNISEEIDPIMQDIFTKKVFMKYNNEQGIYYCDSCGDKLVKQNNLINSPKKILKVAGINPREESGEIQNFTVAVDKESKNEYEINYNIDPQVETFDIN